MERVVLEDAVVAVVRNHNGQIEVVSDRRVDGVRVVEVGTVADVADHCAGVVLQGLGEGGADSGGETVAEAAALVREVAFSIERKAGQQGELRGDTLVNDVGVGVDGEIDEFGERESGIKVPESAREQLFPLSSDYAIQ